MEHFTQSPVLGALAVALALFLVALLLIILIVSGSKIYHDAKLGAAWRNASGSDFFAWEAVRAKMAERKLADVALYNRSLARSELLARRQMARDESTQV